MAKRNLSLFKKTAVEPEVLDETPTSSEMGSGAGGGVLVQYDSGLDEAPPGFIKPLTAAETKRRAELEGLIKQNLAAFLAVGYAMREIRDSQLYRTTHRSFSDYCKDVCEMARSTAYQFIDAADVVDIIRSYGQNKNVSNCGQIEWVPQNESQARVLIKFKDDPDAHRWLSPRLSKPPRMAKSPPLTSKKPPNACI